MKSLKYKLIGAGVAMSAFLASASAVLAQTDYEWDSTYDTTTSDAAAGGLFAMGIFTWVLVCCGGILVIANLVMWIISLIHCIQNAPEDKKTTWLLIIILVPFGAWIYFFTKKKEFSQK